LSVLHQERREGVDLHKPHRERKGRKSFETEKKKNVIYAPRRIQREASGNLTEKAALL